MKVSKETLDKIDKYRRVLDWAGVIGSFAAAFYVESMGWKIAFVLFGTAGAAFTLLKVDNKVRDMMVRKLVAKRTSQG